eukprot:g1555.t1
MMQIPLKRGIDVDLVTPLQKYLAAQDSKTEKKSGFLSRVFSTSTSTVHDDVLKSFQKLRESALQATGGTDASLETWTKYYSALCFSESRFPISAAGGDVRILFSWQNAFARQPRKTSKHSLAFEKAAVLYNIGALDTHCGVEIDRSQPEGLKNAAKHMQRAAGSFSAALQIATDAGGFEEDLSEGMLELCRDIALSSAQTCFYEKAVMTKMSNKLLARLALGTADSFRQAAATCEAQMGTFKWLEKAWHKKLLVQVCSFDAAAHFWQAKVEAQAAQDTGSGYGVQVTRLKVAEQLLLDAQAASAAAKWSGQEAVMGSIDALQAKVIDLRQSAEDDNRTIYMDIIPDEEELEAIQAAKVAKPIDFSLDGIGGAGVSVDIFEQIIPAAAAAAAEEFHSEVAKLLGELRGEATLQTDIARAQLASLGLPASVEAAEAAPGLPRSTWEKIFMIQASGGTAELQARLEKGLVKRKDVMDMLARAESMLAAEAKEDEWARRKHQKAWQRQASAPLAVQYTDEIARCREVISQAASSDDVVRSKLRHATSGGEGKGWLQLAETKENLDALLPGNAQADHSAAQEKQVVQLAMVKLGELLKERDTLLEELEALGAKEAANIVVLLTRDKDGVRRNAVGKFEVADKDGLLKRELSKFDVLKQKLKDSITRQTGVLSEVSAANDSFLKHRKESDHTARRQAVLQGLQDAIVLFSTIDGHLKEGEAFYDGVFERATQLISSVSDFCTARSEECRDLGVAIAQKQQSDAAAFALAKKEHDAMMRREEEAKRMAQRQQQQHVPSYQQQAPPAPPSYQQQATPAPPSYQQPRPTPSQQAPSYQQVAPPPYQPSRDPPPPSQQVPSYQQPMPSYAQERQFDSRATICSPPPSGNVHHASPSAPYHTTSNGRSTMRSSANNPPPPAYHSISSPSNNLYQQPPSYSQPPPSYSASPSPQQRQQQPPPPVYASKTMEPPSYANTQPIRAVPATVVQAEPVVNNVVVQAVPARAELSSPASVDQYRSQIQQLEQMGFTNRQVNVKALEKANGNVDQAIEILLS